ncbi:MAG: PASTA domain-containing protein, partial [Acetatifactor sp.]|nr:PASTA domain-containing protein [Acetatifactor sp.]
NVMGSVHYTSPEQARGGYSDEKSDIYSLGITMFEMLTGRVPFNGETTVAIAIKHIQEELPSPKEYVPEIPTSVESIVFKCCQKSPDRRYQNMQELIADLKQSLINPDEDFVVHSDPDTEAGTRMITDSDREQIKNHSGYHEVNYHDNRDYNESESGGMRLRSDTAAYDLGQDEDDEYDYDPKFERVTTILAIVAGIVICIIIGVLALKVFGGASNKEPEAEQEQTVVDSEEQSEPEYVSMPDIIGVSAEDARRSLETLGLIPEVVYEESEIVDEGLVIRADAEKNTQIMVGSKVELAISAGTEGVEVPDVSGSTYEEAKAKLENLGFAVNKTENYSETAEAGMVVSQMPISGTKAPKESTITVNVSLGKEDVKVRVPNLIGLTEEDGTVEALEQKLQIGNVTYTYNSEVGEGMICYQSYAHGSYVEPDTVIDIKISKGPEPTQNKSYRCNTSITAPDTTEAPDYTPGSEVHVQLATDGGQVLLDTVTTSFPQAANYYGLSSSAGTITMTYTVTTPGTTQTDPDTGETISTPGTSEQKSFTRRIEFTEE